MNTNYPHGHGHYPQHQTPPPPKKKTGKILGFGCLGVVAFFVVAGIGAAALSGGEADESKPADAVADAADKGGEKDAAKDSKADDKPKQSALDKFTACVAKSGTDTEKAAVKHVTKLTGADDQNNILDSAEVFTDFTGGMMGPHQGEGKLIASAFASCHKSDNGLVTVYDKDGEILANGNF